ncbi:MAG: CbtB-domain containing protein [Betaproteobacteria bacterium]|nr:CbtB-domain containing protein [Betaproteobacteria bacterium]
MQSKATTIVATTRAAAVPVWLQIATAFLLGAVIVYGAGFVQASAVHNTAHDMRHAQGFPCH